MTATAAGCNEQHSLAITVATCIQATAGLGVQGWVAGVGCRVTCGLCLKSEAGRHGGYAWGDSGTPSARLGCRIGVQGWAEEAWVYPWCAEVWYRCSVSGLNVRKQDYRVGCTALGPWVRPWGLEGATHGLLTPMQTYP